MRSVGGELEHNEISESIYFTDSGRSSLRLFIRSGNAEKIFLIPDFLCNVIEDVLKQEKVIYYFYNILNDLSVNVNSIQGKEYDVLYVINYFGMVQDLGSLEIKNKIVIEDNVFFNDFINTKKYEKWYSFNSYRKISSLSDGSMIKTNLPVDSDFVRVDKADFVEMKEKAKNEKYRYLINEAGSECNYIKLFDKAENIINDQRDIYSMSDVSLYHLLYQNDISNQKLLKERFELMKHFFSEYSFEKNPEHYSFFPMYIENRDNLKLKMKKHRIFLPVHWPGSIARNNLYKGILSIPLFDTYKDDEFMYLVEKLKGEVYG